MSRFLPIFLLAAGLVLLFTAFASASPRLSADAVEDALCEAVAAEASVEPSTPKAHCWKKIGLGKVLPTCPTERAVLTSTDMSVPSSRSDPVFETAPAFVPFIVTGFDPPPPKA